MIRLLIINLLNSSFNLTNIGKFKKYNRLFEKNKLRSSEFIVVIEIFNLIKANIK